ncbi:hypothetical protein LCGC14_1889340 [marine sediment metagenome]|uniref:Uncharacterized protein n=1 Tax=marine sediment metagenome TaxID=412755 RepID=A0A0F9G054_9ZZZZ
MTDLPTKADLIHTIKLMGLLPGSQIGVPKPLEIAERLRNLLALYEKPGMPIVEVDIYLLGEEPGVAQRSQIHTFAVDDDYKVLPEDEDHDIAEWKVQDIRAHLVKKV